MATSVKPFLMFESSAQAAMNLYVSLFPGAAITRIDHYAAGEMGAEGSVKQAEFVLAGQRILCFDSPVKHAFTFTPSVSLFVDVESENELDTLYAALSQDGKVMMEPANYGFSQKFTWVADRFGVSWQLNLP